jgi:hypothetical protein
MNKLTEENFVLFQQYLNMISLVEEGFAYVKASFTDYTKTEGELVLSDILQAFTSIAQSNTLLEQLLADDESVQKAIKMFQPVIAAVFKLEGQLEHCDVKMNIIREFLYPAFATWKEIIWNALNRYVSQ